MKWQNLPDKQWSELSEKQKVEVKKKSFDLTEQEREKVSRFIDSRYSVRYSYFIVYKNPDTISEAIELSVKQINRDPYDINDGNCDRFARRIDILFEDVEIHTVGMYEEDPFRYGGHAFIYSSKTDLFYDASCPKGTDDWKKLPIVVRSRWQEESGEWVKDISEIPIDSC